MHSNGLRISFQWLLTGLARFSFSERHPARPILLPHSPCSSGPRSDSESSGLVSAMFLGQILTQHSVHSAFPGTTAHEKDVVLPILPN